MADNSELQEKIRDEFTERVRTDKKLAEIREKIENGGDYSIAEQYAERSGQILSEVLRANVTSENFPVGSVEEIAGLIIPPMEQNHGFVSNATAAVQKALNKKGNLGLNAVTPEFDSKSGMHIAGRMAQYEFFEDAEWMLDEPMVTDSIGITDTILRENADFQYRSGLRPKIIRTAEADCCEWCASLEGEYDYAEVADKGNPIYQRHNNCRCEVTFDPGSGKAQDVWSKAVFDKDSSKDDRVSAIRSKEVQLARREQSKAEARIKKAEATAKAIEVLGYSPKGASIWYNTNKADIEKYGLEYMLDYTRNQASLSLVETRNASGPWAGDDKGFVIKTPGQREIEAAIKEQMNHNNDSSILGDMITNNHKDLKNFTPESMLKMLEDAGFTVTPLKKSGSGFNDRTLDEGGGYITHFCGNAIFQYHPAGGLHKIAYWKINYSKGGKHHYDTNGREFIIEKNGKITFID